MLFDGMGGLSLSLSASRTFSGRYWTHLKYSCDTISVCVCVCESGRYAGVTANQMGGQLASERGGRGLRGSIVMSLQDIWSII